MPYRLKAVTIRTNNSEESIRKIAELWEDLLTGKLPLLSDGIVPISQYSNYESNEKGDYDISIVGVEHNFFEDIEKEVEKGLYKKYEAVDENGSVELCTKKAWENVWNDTHSGILKRAFTIDYESSVSAEFSKDGKSTLLFVYSSEIKYWEGYLKEAGSNAFTLSPLKWISTTNAVGLFVRLGRGGGTFAHKDIAFKFASWLSAEFELYIIKDYQRLKDDENSKLSLNWNLNREISKINYKIHTDAIKTYLLGNLTKEQLSYKYASEADMLNVALFNKRAKEWKEENPKLKVNI